MTMFPEWYQDWISESSHSSVTMILYSTFLQLPGCITFPSRLHTRTYMTSWRSSLDQSALTGKLTSPRDTT